MIIFSNLRCCKKNLKPYSTHFYLNFIILLPAIAILTNYSTIPGEELKKMDGAILATTSYSMGDLNLDWKLNLEDIAYYFIYTVDSMEVLFKNDSILKRIDIGQDGELDSLDTEILIYYILNPLMGPLSYTPTLVQSDILSYFNDRVRAIARRQLEWIEAKHPEWKYKIVGIRRQLGLTELPPIPISYDLNNNGDIDINDYAISFLYFGDSLYLLPLDNRKLQSMDYNADGKVNIFDFEAFFIPPFFEDSYNSNISLDASILSNISEKTKYIISRLLAWLQDGAFRDRYHNSEPRGNDYYTWVDYKVKNLLLPIFKLEPSPPFPTPGDINLDFIRRVDDAVIFFNYFSDSLEVLPDTHQVVAQMDLNFDGRVDTLDVENFFFFLFYKLVLPAVPLDSLPPLSLNARNSALAWLDKMRPLHPEWKYGGPLGKTDKILLLHDYFSGIPVSCDINGDSQVNIADAIALIMLGRDQGPAADWNGDGAFGISDIISYILDVRDGKCD